MPRSPATTAWTFGRFMRTGVFFWSDASSKARICRRPRGHRRQPRSGRRLGVPGEAGKCPTTESCTINRRAKGTAFALRLGKLYDKPPYTRRPGKRRSAEAIRKVVINAASEVPTFRKLYESRRKATSQASILRNFVRKVAQKRLRKRQPSCIYAKNRTHSNTEVPSADVSFSNIMNG